MAIARALDGSGMPAAQASGTSAPAPEPWYWAGAGALALGGAAVGTYLASSHPPHAIVEPAGIGAFAPVYLIAQAIERALEPVSHSLDSKSSKTEKTQERDSHVAAAINATDPATDLASAAGLQAQLDQLRANKAAIMWGLASLLAMLACGYLGLDLLKTVGITNGPLFITILVTGLAIGGGTKPLHDLISNLERSSGDKQKPGETGG